MTWGELCELFDEQIRSLPPAPISEIDLAKQMIADPDSLSDLCQSTEKDIRASIRVFSRTRTWPDLSPAELTLIHFRLESASALAFFLSSCQNETQLGIKDPTLDEEDLIEWALGKSWSWHGTVQNHDKIIALAEAYCAGAASIDKPN